MTVVPDVLAENPDIVFCGTAVGNVSTVRGPIMPGWATCSGPRFTRWG